MKKEMKIEGMTCNHCKAHVENALNSIDGVVAKVNLAKKSATLNLAKDVSDDMLKNAVTEAGYGVISISDKKGFFGMKAEKDKVQRLLKTARGQLDGLLKMVEEDRYCIDISTQIMATQAILRKVNREILHAHINGCVKEALEKGNAEDKINEIMNIVDKLSK